MANRALGVRRRSLGAVPRRSSSSRPTWCRSTTTQGRYAFASPAHHDVLGYEPDELIGRLPLDFIHPDEVESVAIEFAAQLAGERPPAPVEMRFRCRDGSYRVLEAVAVDLSSRARGRRRVRRRA